MDPTDAYDKENLSASQGGVGVPAHMKPTASSKSRFGAPTAAAPTGLRPNLNNGSGATRPATARGDFGVRSAPTSPTKLASTRPAGVADLNSFRARLNVVKRESMMRQHGVGGSGSALSEMPAIAETHGRGTTEQSMEEQMFGGEDPFDVGSHQSQQDSVRLLNVKNFEDPEFVEVLEKCLHWRPKALKGYDMKAVKEEARVAINNLKQCLQQSLVRKENLVEDVARAEQNKAQSMEGLRMQCESANASANATVAELEGTKKELKATQAKGDACVLEVKSHNESLTQEVKSLTDKLDFEKRSAEDNLEAKNVELSNLRRRHEESQESLRTVRDDLKTTREALSRAERETAAIRRDRENGESSYAAERKALEVQIRAKIEEVAETRNLMTKQKSEMELNIRTHIEKIEKLTVQNKLLTSSAEEAEVGLKSARSSLTERLAETETTLESAQRALSREKLRFEETELDLTKALTDTRAKCDDLEQKLSRTDVEVVSLKESLSQERRKQEDAQHEMNGNLGAKSAEVEKLNKTILNLKNELTERDADMKALRGDLKESKDASARIAVELENVSNDRREERVRVSAEINQFKLEASENKYRADALLTQQAQLMADVKEERARVAKAEEERKDALLGGAATAEQARQQAREDLRFAEARHENAKQEMLVEKTTAVEAAKEKAALEVAQAKSECDKLVEEAELKAAKASEAAKKTAEVAVEEADSAADEAEAMVESLKEKLEQEKADAEARIAELNEKLLNAQASIEQKTAEVVEKLELAAGETSSAVQQEREKALDAAGEAEKKLEELRTELAEKVAAAEEEAGNALALERETAKQTADDMNAQLEQFRTALRAAESEHVETVEQLNAQIELAKQESLDAVEKLGALEAANAAVAAEMSESLLRHTELVEQATSAEARVQNVVAQLENEQKEVDRLEKEAKETAQAMEVEKENANEALKAAASEKADMDAELRALRAAAGIGDDGEELTEEQRLAAAAEFENLSTQHDMSAKDATALTSRLVKATKAAEVARRVATDMETHKKVAEERLRRIEELESQALDADAVRRALHNQIQELRGNVRVFCRVRPTTSDTAIVQCPADGSSVTLTKTDSKNPNETSPVGFEFDRVFSPESTQAEVFEEVSQLVQSALDGYKVCLFSYGQTGSGKTHTMLGEQGQTSELRGVIPRAVAKIVEASEKNKQKGWTYEMHASYVEIYNEQVRDLLNAGSGHSDKHAIVHTPKGITEVSGVRREPVLSVEAAANLVRRASNARAVEATQMNAVSSRSHTIFMLYITGEHVGSGSKLHGCLNLVDLAGSERVGRSGAEGARLKEACAINKSLSCLGDVFQALSNKQTHVPYRNSKLTYILQPCLGGDGKTLMFVNINPEAPSAEESLCSLKFAAQVNAVELGGGRGGGAKRNITSGLTLEKKEEKKEDKKSGSTSENAGKERPKSAAPGGERLKDKRLREAEAEKSKLGKSKIPRARPETARPAPGSAAKKPKRVPCGMGDKQK